MMTHIKAALGTLKEECIKKNQLNKYEVLEMYYIHNVPFDKMATELSCAEITIRRWKNEMIQDLGVYLFGIDAL
mgnify:FL=1